VYGVEPRYQAIANLRVTAGRFFSDDESSQAAPVCVLGEAVRARLFGSAEPLGQFLRVNEQWFTVIGVAGAQAVAQTDVSGLSGQDRNNIIYVPTGASMFRLEDNYSPYRDEIDGIYIRLKPDADVTAAAATIRAILQTNHRGADDYAVIVPAELLAEQQRTKRIFDVVMVALASISLLVGGIGIMNIMLASVLERTPEIGVRRAVGARQADIIRQFVLETTLIGVAGGTLGLIVGALMSRLIANFAGWSTIISAGSVLLAFSVSVLVGLVFGVYPAMKAARLDPVKALHYQ
jgi:putative ABC transport system permease protein